MQRLSLEPLVLDQDLNILRDSVWRNLQKLQDYVNILQQGTNPVGTILGLETATVPDGYLLLDGSVFSGTDYPELEAYLGGTTLPDYRGRFLVGRNAGVAEYDTLGETGGSKDAVTTSHDHPVTVNTHFSSTGQNNNNTSPNGTHAHAIDGDYGNRIAVTVITGAHRIPDVGAVPSGQDVSFSDIDDDGSHEHTLNNHSHNIDHDHSGFSDAVGSSGTGANLPPYRVINWFIKT